MWKVTCVATSLFERAGHSQSDEVVRPGGGAKEREEQRRGSGNVGGVASLVRCRFVSACSSHVIHTGAAIRPWIVWECTTSLRTREGSDSNGDTLGHTYKSFTLKCFRWIYTINHVRQRVQTDGEVNTAETKFFQEIKCVGTSVSTQRHTQIHTRHSANNTLFSACSVEKGILLFIYYRFCLFDLLCRLPVVTLRNVIDFI
jgi:hypothetical protein